MRRSRGIVRGNRIFDPERIPSVSVEDVLYMVQEMARRHKESDDEDLGLGTATMIMIARYPGQVGMVIERISSLTNSSASFSLRHRQKAVLQGRIVVPRIPEIYRRFFRLDCR